MCVYHSIEWKEAIDIINISDLMGEFDLSYLLFFPCSLERLGFFFFLSFFFFFFTTMDMPCTQKIVWISEQWHIILWMDRIMWSSIQQNHCTFFFYCTFNKAKSHYWTQSNLRYFYYQCLQMKEARKIIAVYWLPSFFKYILIPFPKAWGVHYYIYPTDEKTMTQR